MPAWERVSLRSFLDSIYFTSVALTTVGYGDLTPQTATWYRFRVGALREPGLCCFMVYGFMRAKCSGGLPTGASPR